MDKKPYFVFDLDSTVTSKEILPELAKSIGLYEQMREATEAAMSGQVDYAQSLRKRVELLREIPVSRAAQLVREIPLHPKLRAFLINNRHRCFIVTANLDVWVIELMRSLQMEDRFYASEGLVSGDRLVGAIRVLDKAEVAQKLERPFIAVGDGCNDLPLIHAAELGIGFGATRPVAACVKLAADHCFDTEDTLCRFLNQYL